MPCSEADKKHSAFRKVDVSYDITYKDGQEKYANRAFKDDFLSSGAYSDPLYIGCTEGECLIVFC